MLIFFVRDLYRLRDFLAREIHRREPGFRMSEFFADRSEVWEAAVAGLIDASLTEDLKQTTQLSQEAFGALRNTIDNPSNMTVSETAKFLKISINTVYKWVSQGKLPHRKIGGKKLGFNKEELDKFLASQRVPGDEEIERDATRRAITFGARRNYSRRT